MYFECVEKKTKQKMFGYAKFLKGYACTERVYTVQTL